MGGAPDRSPCGASSRGVSGKPRRFAKCRASSRPQAFQPAAAHPCGATTRRRRRQRRQHLPQELSDGQLDRDDAEHRQCGRKRDREQGLPRDGEQALLPSRLVESESIGDRSELGSDEGKRRSESEPDRRRYPRGQGKRDRSAAASETIGGDPPDPPLQPERGRRLAPARGRAPTPARWRGRGNRPAPGSSAMAARQARRTTSAGRAGAAPAAALHRVAKGPLLDARYPTLRRARRCRGKLPRVAPFRSVPPRSLVRESAAGAR
jgi:hypothetical protein